MIDLSQNRVTKISKYLSYHLRHRPEMLGLELLDGGWVEIKKLLRASEEHKFPIAISELRYVVEYNDKKRFSFDLTGTLIRANQGHSVPVNLQLKPVIPPNILYHGTYLGAVESIKRLGLQKMSRHHVHLSSSCQTAKVIGARRGKPIVFEVDAKAMHQAKFIFYRSENGVWLVDSIPTNYLKLS